MGEMNEVPTTAQQNPAAQPATDSESPSFAERLENAVRNYAESHLPKSKYIHLLGDIPEKVLAGHKKAYAPIKDDEKVLMLVNQMAPGACGLCITDKCLYARLNKDGSVRTLFFGLFMKKKVVTIPVNGISEVTIGENFYISNHLFADILVNGTVIGNFELQCPATNNDTEQEFFQIIQNSAKK